MTTAALNLPPGLATKLDEAVKRIVEIANPRLVILFGSHAHGQPRPDSDVDLLVVAETENRAELFVALRHEVVPLIAPLRVDFLIHTPGGWEHARHMRGFVTRDADRQGVRLYEAAV